MEQEKRNKNITELRKSAQVFLEKKDPGDLTEEDVRQLVHELDTYRIELELQNEDLRNSQEQLEKSYRRYADLYEFAPIAYITVSEKGMILEANLTAADMLGVERGQLVNRLFSDFIFADDQDVFYHQRKKLLQTRRKQSYELRLQRNGGQVFHAFIETVVGSEEPDQQGQFRLMVNDISLRKQAELERLRLLKDRYRAIVMDQSDLICRFDSHGRITFVNDAYCRYFGVSHHEILGSNFLPNIHQDDLPLVRDHFKSLTPLEPVKTIEHRVHMPDGRVSWHQWSGRALFDREGNIIECQAVGRDITELKEAEEKLHFELRLRQLFMDALPCAAILVKHHTHEIVSANKMALAAGAVTGTRCFESWAKRDDPCHWCLAPKLWESGEPQNTQFWNFGKFWDAYWVPVDGELYLQYAFDITEQQKNKEALKRAKEECEQQVIERTLELQKSHEQLLHSEKLAAVGNLSASIAHEFNNPLQSVMTIIKGIGQYATLDRKEAELVALALQECKRMGSLIANLQDFHRPTTGKVEPVDLHAVIDALLLMSKKDFHNRKISVEKKYADNFPVIMAVTDQLKQVFLNLFNNAADACEGGGAITISTEKIGRKYVAVHVGDSGAGIDPVNLGHIFEPFFTTKPALKGTGLGLSVSYGIIKKHGGHIEVKSERGKGAQFSVFLPIEAIHDQH